MDEYNTELHVGAQLIQILSSSLYRNAYYVFEELISNAYDADATEVKISIAQNKLIKISDNGTGMDREGLDNYLWLGYSSRTADRITKRFRRNTIGKFGIGKLSMHVLCDKCTIETVKDRKKLICILNFPDILSKKGINEHKIVVKESEVLEPNGTTITLEKLKRNIDPIQIRRRIVKTMPLNPEFKVFVNEVMLSTEDILSSGGQRYNIEFENPLVGKVQGTIFNSSRPLGDFAGVYIRVFGRVVNADDPDILDFRNTLTHGAGLIARIYGLIDANGLDKVILADRSHFREDSPEFEEFKKALLKEVRQITKNIQETHNTENIEVEKKLLDAIVRKQIPKMLENVELPEDWMVRASNRPDADRVKAEIERIKRKQSERVKKAEQEPNKLNKHTQDINRINKQNERRIIKIGRKKFAFKLINAGKDAYECLLDEKEAVLYVNLDHTQYLLSRKEESLPHHFRRIIAFELCRSMSGQSAVELCEHYGDMMRQEITIEGSLEDEA